MYEQITLGNLLNGALQEKFAYELEKVKSNIADINTKTGIIRELNIKIQFLPNEESSKLLTKVELSSKLAPVKGGETILSFVKENGKLGIFQEISEQKPLFPEEEKNDNEVDFNIKETINNG